MRRADRLFRIVLLLGRGRATTARELATALEVSLRTIYRDVADLVASGVPVDGEAGVGYRLRSGYRLPALMFDEEELHALALGVRMVRGWADPALARAADTALARIEAVLPAHLRERPLQAPFIVPDFHVPPEMVAPLGLVRQAIAERRKLLMSYRRADEVMSERTIWPLGLVFWGGTWTLGAWCELRQEFRTFRTDRMLALTLSPDSYPLQPGTRLADYLRSVAEEGCDGSASPS